MPRRLRPLSLVLVVALALGIAGCRGCDETRAEPPPQGPPMPSGMLVPLPLLSAVPSAAPPATPAARLTLASGRRSGEWVELQPGRPDDAPDRRLFDRYQDGSRFLSLDAMPLLHGAFARALPGFDLFVPRRFDAPALGRLRAELVALKAEVAGIRGLAGAKGVFGEVSALVASLPDDAAWAEARAALLALVDDLVALADRLERSGASLWVLGS